METITAILEPEADGTLHVPVPENMRHAKFKVVATPEEEPTAVDETERARQQRVLDCFERLRASNPFKDIEDVVAWQRDIRRDRELPWDEARGKSDEPAP